MSKTALLGKVTSVAYSWLSNSEPKKGSSRIIGKQSAAVYRHELHVERKNDLEEAIRRGKEEEVRLEKERTEKIEEEKRQKLFSDAADWRRASEIREYVEAALVQLEGGTQARYFWLAGMGMLGASRSGPD